VVGGGGYVAGELLRLLARHPHVEIAAVVSRTHRDRLVHKVHPHLRGLGLKFRGDYSFDADAVFLALPHGLSMKVAREFVGRMKVIDLSADFRLSRELYERYYGPHEAPELLGKFVYGLPELYRERIRGAELIANPGCNATAAIIALYPVKDAVKEALVDVKAASSAGGRGGGMASLHAERAHVVRVYAEGSHRHEAEVLQATGIRARITAHAVDMVRGLMATIYLQAPLGEAELFRRFSIYSREPFVRLVREKGWGLQRLPDPKYVLGSNFVDVGFTGSQGEGGATLYAALDNLVKGAAGQAVQNMNLAFGLAEAEGLEQLPLFPA